MANNEKLHKAKTAKNDEFYTVLSDIEKELRHYRDKFKDKTVFCNCDDPFESNFVKFFLMHFNEYGLKALYATGYKTSSIVDTELKVKKEMIPYSLHVTSTKKYLTGDGEDLTVKSAKIFIEESLKSSGGIVTPLTGDEEYVAGDFRSQESLALLEKSDIVVTNPPFSLFREYVGQLIEYNKQFLIIGSQNAITYKEIFSLIKDNKMWLGNGFDKGNAYFKTPFAEDYSVNVFNPNTGLVKFRNCCWFTNIDHLKRHTSIPLDAGYTYYGHEEQYPKYDNYDAINVDKINEIPNDYMEAMGVPITFLDKYCPEQFEIIDCNDIRKPHMKKKQYALIKDKDGTVNGVTKYARIVIRRKETKLNGDGNN